MVDGLVGRRWPRPRRQVYELFRDAEAGRGHHATSLLPVGTDYTPPNKWVTAHPPRLERALRRGRGSCAATRASSSTAVRAELAEREVAPSPQTRDMNPIYTGKDVSFIDTKQAQRAAEVAALDAEKLADVRRPARAGPLSGGARWTRSGAQLAYGAHHDAITGSESDQVYIDLLTGWRDACDLADGSATTR